MENETELKKYFKKNKIKVTEAAEFIGISKNQLYMILNGICRPRNETAARIFLFVDKKLPLSQIRPPLDRPKCPVCNRLLKKHHMLEIRTRENKEKKMKKKNETPKNDTIVSVKKRKGLLAL